MHIEVAGKTWIVEEQELARSSGSAPGRFSGITFRNAREHREELHVRWVLRPERLTHRLARELFEIAGVRVWQDPRDARRYRLRLETSASAPSGLGAPTPVEAVRFQSRDGQVQVPWTLRKPLGLASDAELIGLLDSALEEGA